MLEQVSLERLAVIAMASGFLVMVGGCLSAERAMPARVPVEGVVTLDGTPLRQGRIEFKTVSSGLIDGLAIEAGKYAGTVGVGDRRVEFSVLRQTAYRGSAMPGVAMPASVPEETLPQHLNQHSRYSVTVSQEGPNEFDFELSSKPGK